MLLSLVLINVFLFILSAERFKIQNHSVEILDQQKRKSLTNVIQRKLTKLKVNLPTLTSECGIKRSA